jgi:hypothetical protein
VHLKCSKIELNDEKNSYKSDAMQSHHKNLRRRHVDWRRKTEKITSNFSTSSEWILISFYCHQAFAISLSFVVGRVTKKRNVLKALWVTQKRQNEVLKRSKSSADYY